MNIKKIVNITLLFIAKRLTEIFGFLILSAGIFLFVSLISYSPEDPNFIFPENTEIRNLLGFRGSYISDIFFQSIGLVSYLFTFTLIFTGINVTLKKDFFLIIENTFYSILYSIFFISSSITYLPLLLEIFGKLQRASQLLRLGLRHG